MKGKREEINECHAVFRTSEDELDWLLSHADKIHDEIDVYARLAAA